MVDFDYSEEEYLKRVCQIKYYGSVKKTTLSFLICKLIRKSITLKKIQGEKHIQTLIFPKCCSAYSDFEVLIRRNVM